MNVVEVIEKFYQESNVHLKDLIIYLDEYGRCIFDENNCNGVGTVAKRLVYHYNASTIIIVKPHSGGIELKVSSDTRYQAIGVHRKLEMMLLDKKEDLKERLLKYKG